MAGTVLSQQYLVLHTFQKVAYLRPHLEDFKVTDRPFSTGAGGMWCQENNKSQELMTVPREQCSLEYGLCLQAGVRNKNL